MGYFDIGTLILPLPSDPRNKGCEPRDGLAIADVPGYWVEIKDELSFDDVQERQARVVRLESKGSISMDTATAKWEIEQFSLVTLQRALIAWNLTKGTGREEAVLPISTSTVKLLANKDADFILGHVLKRNPSGDKAAEGKASDSETTTKPFTDEEAASPKSLE